MEERKEVVERKAEKKEEAGGNQWIGRSVKTMARFGVHDSNHHVRMHPKFPMTDACIHILSCPLLLLSLSVCVSVFPCRARCLVENQTCGVG